MSISFPVFAGTRAQRQGTLFLDSLDSTTRANCLLAASACRRLNSQYYGPLIRVVESGSNSELNIDSIGIGQELDQSSLLAHVGSNNGSVKILYDQSNNGKNFVQNTISKQPKIAELGVVVTQSGKPALKFDGIDDILATVNNLAIDIECLVILIGRSVDDGFAEHSPNINSNDGLFLYMEEGTYMSRSGTIDKADIPVLQRPWGSAAASILSLLSYNNDTLEARTGTVVSATDTYSTSGVATDILYLGGRNGVLHSEAYYQEFYVFNNDNSAQFTNIINSLNSYFSYH